MVAEQSSHAAGVTALQLPDHLEHTEAVGAAVDVVAEEDQLCSGIAVEVDEIEDRAQRSNVPGDVRDGVDALDSHEILPCFHGSRRR